MQPITSMRECLREKHATPADRFDQAALVQLFGRIDSMVMPGSFGCQRRLNCDPRRSSAGNGTPASVSLGASC